MQIRASALIVAKACNKGGTHQYFMLPQLWPTKVRLQLEEAQNPFWHLKNPLLHENTQVNIYKIHVTLYHECNK